MYISLRILWEFIQKHYKRLNRRRSNNFRTLNKMPKATEKIKLNTKEIQELIKEESKTNCD